MPVELHVLGDKLINLSRNKLESSQYQDLAKDHSICIYAT